MKDEAVFATLLRHMKGQQSAPISTDQQEPVAPPRAAEHSYLENRISACQRAAQSARGTCARRAHLDLAERYRCRREALLAES